MFKALIVDDELYTREGLKILINWKELGFEVCGLAENGQQAFELIKVIRPELVVTDIKMPLMNGLELIKKVNEETELDARFIVLSGYNEFQYAKEAMRFGVKDYILKPIEKEDLVTVVKKQYEELIKEKKDKEANLRAVNALSEVSLKTILKSTADRESVDNVITFLNVGYTGQFSYILLEVEIGKCKDDAQMDESNNCHIIRDYLINILGEEYKYNILKEDSNKNSVIHYGIIVTEELLKNYESNEHSFVEEIFLQLTEKLHKKINMYVGKTVNELILLRESYDSALFTYSIRCYKKNSNVIYYDEIKDIPVSSDFNEKFNFDNLVEAIENNNSVEIDRIISNFFVEEDSNPLDLKLLQLKINYLVYQIIMVVSKMNGDTTEIVKYSSKFQFDNYSSFEDIMDSIKGFSEHCARFINNLKQNQCLGIFYDVERYIHENYYKRITIKEVANQFYINSAYLGQIFKKKYGVSFTDYIHQYRMTKAKELLKHTDFKIYEISEKLGYKSSYNFIEKFEKMNGITPLQYRRILNS